MKYKSDDVLKSRIYFIAKKMFYDFGYEKTTIRQIAKEAEVSVGLLNYYFGSKEKLAIKIYEEIKDKVGAIVVSNFKELPDVLMLMYAIIFDIFLQLDNVRLRSFYVDFCETDELSDNLISQITIILKRYNKDLKSLTMNAISLAATKNKLISTYDRKILGLSKKEIGEYLIEFYSVRLKIDDYDFSNLYNRIVKAYMDLNIEISSNFEVKYSKK